MFSIEMPITPVTAIQSLIRYSAGGTGMTRLHEFYISQDENDTAEQLEATVFKEASSNGVGTTGTFVPWDKTDTADGNFVYDLSSEPTGLTKSIKVEGFNILNGWIWIPTQALWLTASERIVLKLTSAPAASLNMTAGIHIEEMGG